MASEIKKLFDRPTIFCRLTWKRLVSAPGTARYFALSYVWGKDAGEDVLETTKENIEAHQRKGFLSLEQHDLCLPETIKGSMRLVKRLNGRYL